jgi:hypothetical protein
MRRRVLSPLLPEELFGRQSSPERMVGRARESAGH